MIKKCDSFTPKMDKNLMRVSIEKNYFSNIDIEVNNSFNKGMPPICYNRGVVSHVILNHSKGL